MTDRTITEIPLDELHDSPFNPPNRATLAIADLAASIQAEPEARPVKTHAQLHGELQRLLGRMQTIVGQLCAGGGERLKRMPPEVAVAQGKAKFSPGSRRTFDIGGKPHTVGDLARLAGVSWTTMWQRLQRHSARGSHQLRQAAARRAALSEARRQAGDTAAATGRPARAHTQGAGRRGSPDAGTHPRTDPGADGKAHARPDAEANTRAGHRAG